MNRVSKSKSEPVGQRPIAFSEYRTGESRALEPGKAKMRAALASLVLAACGSTDGPLDPLAPPGAPSAAHGAPAGGAPNPPTPEAEPPTTAPSLPTDSAEAGPMDATQVPEVPVAPEGIPGATPIASPSADPDDAEAPASEEPSAAPALLPKCVTKDSQVLLIGDSYINWISHSFPADLARISGQNWRLEAVGGTSLATGGIGLLGLGYIPDQLDHAMTIDPDAHTIVLSGGGNDILVRDTAYAPNSCTKAGSSQDAGCQLVVSMASEAAKKLMLDAASVGIRDIVYFFYPHVPANTILTEDDPNEILDYALPQARAVCEGAEAASGGSLRCTFVDLVPVFEGHPEYINGDIHPNQVGGRVMAETIWQVMQDHCIGQKGVQDCCEP
jgi:hypothetical protein